MLALLLIMTAAAAAIVVWAGRLRRGGGPAARIAQACRWVALVSLVLEAVIQAHAMRAMSEVRDAAADVRQAKLVHATSLASWAAAAELALLGGLLVVLAGMARARRRRAGVPRAVARGTR